MSCLRLNYTVYCSVDCDYICPFIQKLTFILINCSLRELSPSMRNEWCQVDYFCFTRELHCLLNCWCYQVLSLHQVLLLYTFQFVRQLNVLPEVVIVYYTVYIGVL